MIKVSEFIEQHKAGKVPASTMIKMAAFKAELEKTATGQELFQAIAQSGFIRGLGSNLKDMAIYGGSMGVGALIFEAVRGAERAWENYRLDASKQPKFNEIVAMHPDLKDKEELAARYFDALWHFSPVLAQEPMSAGAYIKQALQMHHVAQGPLPEFVSKVTEIQRNVKQGLPQTEYATPLGAMFLSLRPSAGAAHQGNKGVRPAGNPNQLDFRFKR